jgi:predicted site-specific integrase-resolvase
VTAHVREAPSVDRLLSLDDVQRVLGFSEKTVRRLVADGKLATVRLHPHGRLRFTTGDVQRLINASRQPGEAA